MVITSKDVTEADVQAMLAAGNVKVVEEDRKIIDMGTVTGVKEDYVSLGLSIETPIDNQSPIVQDCTVPKPKIIEIIANYTLV